MLKEECQKLSLDLECNVSHVMLDFESRYKVQGTRFLFHVIHITLENIFSLKIYNVVNSVKIIYSFTHSLISHTTRTHTTQ